MAEWKSERLLALIAGVAPRECITEAQLVTLSGYDARCVENCCLKLRRHGLIEKTDRGCHRLTAAGRAAAKAGATLRSGPQGRRTGHLVKRGTLRADAWTYMRRARKFSLDDVVMMVARGGERDIRSNLGRYVHTLARSGYLRALPLREAGLSATSNGAVRYIVVLDNGPMAPVHCTSRGTLYDPNTEEDVPLAAVAATPSKRKREARI